jgi:hypothetical protein
MNQAMTPFEQATRPLMLNSIQRPSVFIEWADRLITRHGLAGASARIWIDLVDEWTCFDRIDHDAYERLLERIKAHRPASITASIPPAPVAVFRGQSGLARPGLSWTTNPQVARRFALGHRGIAVANPVVLRRIVRPEEIAFTSNDRREAEVVIFTGEGIALPVVVTAETVAA